jgi:ParB family transcriptional regulator, chromosome partitioning protein
MDSAQSIEIIPVNAIDVVNPRVRNRRIFKEIVTSVAELGLKRPITVKRKQVEGGSTLRLDLRSGPVASLPEPWAARDPGDRDQRQ